MTLPTHQEAAMSRDSRYLESILHHDIPLLPGVTGEGGVA